MSETWFHEASKYRFASYSQLRKDRVGRRGGGLLTLVRQDVQALQVTLLPFPNGILEFQCVDVFLPSGKLCILHVYAPTSALTPQELEHYVDQLHGRYIVCGDFNAHHQLWDPSVDVQHGNQAGRTIVNLLAAHQSLNLVTPSGLTTHTDPRTGKQSTIDLTFCSSSLLGDIQVQSLADIGSDHLPVLVNISCAVPPSGLKKRPRWIFDASRWVSWSSELRDSSYPCSDSLDDRLHAFNRSVLTVSDTTFKRSSSLFHPNYHKPWWTAECKRLIAYRRKCRRLMERHPTLDNILTARQASAAAKRAIKMAKRKSWAEFCSGLSADTPSALVWRKFRSLKGRPSMPVIRLYGQSGLTQDPARVAALLGTFFQSTCHPSVPLPDIPDRCQVIAAALSDSSDLELDRLFSMQELVSVVCHLKAGKAMGFDEVDNEMIRHLPENKLRELLGIINCSWRLGSLPAIWKLALIVAILKSGKSPFFPTSYRPISLLSCTGKVAEHLVNDRLYWLLESRDLLRRTACAFRKGRGTIDQLCRLENTVRAGLVSKKVVVAVFFDLTRAFDSVHPQALLFKLACCGIKGRLLSWLADFLSGRSFRVCTQGVFSSEFVVASGIPQGSVLSPTLFNVMLNDLPDVSPVLSSEYADDIAYFIAADSMESAVMLMQDACDRLMDWANEWGMSVSPEKTKAMFFTCKRDFPLPSITLGNRDIEWVSTHRFLGVIFDGPYLTYRSHIEYLIQDGVQRLSLLRGLSASTWGADRRVLLRFYKSYVRPKLSYGAELFAGACDSLLQRLCVIQNAALRIALGARRSSPVASLEVEAHVLPLRLYLTQQVVSFYIKSLSRPPSHPLTQELTSSAPALRTLPWTRRYFKAPFLVRAEEGLRSLGLPVPRPAPVSVISPVPPWYDLQRHVCLDLLLPVSRSSPALVPQIFLMTRQIKYEGFLELYTDGSYIPGPPPSSSAAFYIPELSFGNTWKLNPSISVFASELFALLEALKWVMLHSGGNDVVIYSDSYSSLQTILSLSPACEHRLVFNIQSLLYSFGQVASSGTICLQWVPGHSSIPGNVVADRLAKQAHSNNTSFNLKPSPQDRIRQVKTGILGLWQQQWDVDQHSRFLGSIKPTLGDWEWAYSRSRSTETALSRLRLGHVGVFSHLHRFGLVPSPDCPVCHVEETVAHVLLVCHRYHSQRQLLCGKLRLLGIMVPSVRLLLGGDTSLGELNSKVVALTGGFLSATGLLHRL